MTNTPITDNALFPGIDRAHGFSRLSAEEAARILTRLGAEVRFFNPSGLPLVDQGVDATHPKVCELRDLASWCEEMV